MKEYEKLELTAIRKAMSNFDNEYVFSHYERYLELEEIENEEFRERNQESFDKFYKTHIQGKRISDIDPDYWQTYSDWHKDMYGFRPQTA